MRVFLVDDARSIRARIRVSVEEIGAEVVGEARTEEEAVTGVGATHPDVVVIDLRLAKGTGMNVLKSVKSQCPGIVAIVLTNHRQEEYQKPCLQAGADYFLEKTRQYADFEMLLRQMQDKLFTH